MRTKYVQAVNTECVDKDAFACMLTYIHGIQAYIPTYVDTDLVIS